jgi:hypothetical protein
MTSRTQVVNVRSMQDTDRRSGESADTRFLIGAALSLVLVVTAIYAVTVSAGPDPQALAAMVVYP